MRLQRALAQAGVASRRRAEELIRAGLVEVNGEIARIGRQVDPDTDRITVSGRPIPPPSSTVWIALHKPSGYVVTRRDPRGRPTVFELVPDIPGLHYVGRLDIMSSGLLLFTTDGGTANRLLHPRYAVERTYHVRVRGRPAREIERALRQPSVIDGRPVKIVRWAVAAGSSGASTVTLVLAEGRYRIVRRLCAKLGLTVVRLTRRSHGPITLGRLKVGAWRHLTRRECEMLRALHVA